jgi:hypothetical protein
MGGQVLDALSTAAPVTPGTPFTVDVGAGPLTGQLTGVTVTGDALSAHVTIPLPVTLSHTLEGTPAAVTITLSPSTISLPGPPPVALVLTNAAITLGGGDLAVDATGTLTIDGSPDGMSATSLSATRRELC